MNQTCTYLKLKCGMYCLHFLLHLLSLTLNIKITKLSKMNKYKTDDNKNQCLQKLPRIWLRFFKNDIIYIYICICIYVYVYMYVCIYIYIDR